MTMSSLTVMAEGEDLRVEKVVGELAKAGDTQLIKVSDLAATPTVLDEEVASITESTQTEGIYQIKGLKAGSTTVTFANGNGEVAYPVVVADGRPVETIDNEDAEVTYSSGWYHNSAQNPDKFGGTAYGNGIHAHNTNGASGTIAFTGTGFDFLAFYPKAGAAYFDIYVDDQLVGDNIQVSSSDSADLNQAVVFSKYDLVYGEHIVKFEKTAESSSDIYVHFDAFRVYNDSNINVIGVSLDDTDLEIKEGEEKTLTAVVSPENASNKSVTWTSSAENIVTVDENGLVSGKLPGNATITVTTDDGELTAQCEVTVKEDSNIARPSVTGANIENLSVDTTLGFNADPKIHGILRANYTYHDADGKVGSEEGTKFQWYIADERAGNYTPINGIHTQDIILIKEYEGKYLRCEIIVSDVNGVKGIPTVTEPTLQAVQSTDGNHLTDWMVDCYGVSSHFIDHVFNIDGFFEDEDKWKHGVTWKEFIGEFDVETYVDQLEEMGASYWMLTMGQNDGFFPAPSDVYDKYLVEEGVYTQEEVDAGHAMDPGRDLPAEINAEIEKRGLDIKMTLYIPINPPHSATPYEEYVADANGNMAFRHGSYSKEISSKVFKVEAGSEGANSDVELQQIGRQRWEEIIEEFSLRYGEDLAMWWFDGYFSDSLTYLRDLDREYNEASFATVAKAGNPYRVITYNGGVGDVYGAGSPYCDFTSGEATDMKLPNPIPEQRWLSPSKVDGGGYVQMFTWGAVGDSKGTYYYYGRPGLGFSDMDLANRTNTIFGYDGALCFDLNLDGKGDFDAEQVAQLSEVKKLTNPEYRKNIIEASINGATNGGSLFEGQEATLKYDFIDETVNKDDVMVEAKVEPQGFVDVDLDNNKISVIQAPTGKDQEVSIKLVGTMGARTFESTELKVVVKQQGASPWTMANNGQSFDGWNIEQNTFKMVSNGFDQVLANELTSGESGIVEADVKMPGNSGIPGFVLNIDPNDYSDAKKMASIQILLHPDKLELGRSGKVGGYETVSHEKSAGDWVNLKVEYESGRVKIYLDNELYIDHEDPELLTGKNTGLFTWAPKGVEVEFKNFAQSLTSKAETTVGTAPNLPTTVTAVVGSNVEQVEVEWNVISMEKYENVGMFEVRGIARYEGIDIDVMALVTVNEKTSVEPPEEGVDKTALVVAYQTYGKYQESKYTVESWKQFKVSLDAAANIIKDKEATQAEVDAAKQALEAASSKLVEKTITNPETDDPETDDPGTDNPGTDNPGTDNPGTDNSGAGNSGTGNSGSNNSVTIRPNTSTPSNPTVIVRTVVREPDEDVSTITQTLPEEEEVEEITENSVGDEIAQEGQNDAGQQDIEENQVPTDAGVQTPVPGFNWMPIIIIIIVAGVLSAGCFIVIRRRQERE